MAQFNLGVVEASSFLAGRFGSAVSDIEPLAGGDWSAAFGFRLDEKPLVVRFGAWLEDFEKDRIAMTFAGPDLPVPSVLEIGEAFGMHFAISERHFGEFLEELDTEQFRRVLPAVLRALDALRALPAPRGMNFPPWHDWLIEQLTDRPGGRVSGWRAKLAEHGRADLCGAGEERFRALLPRCPELTHVMHRDLINRNVLVDVERDCLEAVFDWGCMAVGDFVYEIAWLASWEPWYPGLAGTDFGSVARHHLRELGVAIPHYPERLYAYKLHIGLTALAYTTVARDDPALTSRVAEQVRELLAEDPTD